MCLVAVTDDASDHELLCTGVNTSPLFLASSSRCDGGLEGCEGLRPSERFERLCEQSGDMHLRETNLLGNFRLGQFAEESVEHDCSFSLRKCE